MSSHSAPSSAPGQVLLVIEGSSVTEGSHSSSGDTSGSSRKTQCTRMWAMLIEAREEVPEIVAFSSDRNEEEFGFYSS